jgi:hypothetical protein
LTTANITSSLILIAYILLSFKYYWGQNPFFELSGIIAALIIFSGRKLLNRSSPVLAVSLICVVIAAAVLPGLSTHPDWSGLEPSLIVEIENNYSFVTTQGDRLATGAHLFRDVGLGYGFLLPAILGTWQKCFHTINLGQYVQIIKVMQLFFLVITAYLYSFHARRTTLGVLIAFLLVLPWYHTNQISLYYPNLSPWRLLTFPIVLFVLTRLETASIKRTAIVLGIVAAFSVFANFESGLAVAAGCLTFMYFRFGPFAPWRLTKCSSAITNFVLGGLIAFATFEFLVFSRFNYFPSPILYFESIWRMMKAVQTGYFGGFPLEFNPMAIIIFVHILYSLLKISFVNRAAAVNFRDSFRASVGVISLVWFAYYINRPAPWYFQAQYFFYGFFLLDLLRNLPCRDRIKTVLFEKNFVRYLILANVILPSIVSGLALALPTYVQALEQLRNGPTRQRAVLVSGVYLTDEEANELIEKASYIKEESKNGPVLYFSSNTELISKLSGVFPSERYDDIYSELIFVHDTEIFVNHLIKEGPTFIYIDNPKNILAGDQFRLIGFDQFRKRLAPGYDFVNAQHGWLVYRRHAQ